MNKVIRNQKGFTLLEVVVVLAVLGALAAMLSPVVFRYVDDAGRARAQNDANVIASAIQQMYEDTGRWPFYGVSPRGVGAVAYASATDAAVLTSNGCATALVAMSTCDTVAPVVPASWGDFTTVKGNSLAKQLIENFPGYTTSGPRAWRGPYLDAVPSVDPWGRSYIVNISDANPGVAAANNVVYVVSAGPNGTVETAAAALATTNPLVGGDDIGARVK